MDSEAQTECLVAAILATRTLGDNQNTAGLAVAKYRLVLQRLRETGGVAAGIKGDD